MIHQTPVEAVFTMLAAGNPGAAHFLVDLAKKFPEDFCDLTLIMAKHHLVGSRVYMLWNDANDRDTAATAELLRKIGSGRLPIDVVEAHLAEGRCRPFTPDEEIQPTAPAKSVRAVAFENTKEGT